NLRIKLFSRGRHGDLRSRGHIALEASALGVGALAAGDPDAAEVGMAVGRARRGRREIGLAVLGARCIRQRQRDPLCLRSGGQTQGEEKAGDEGREFHDGSFLFRYSALSAIAGSTRAARRAGNHTPIRATALRSRGTATKTAGSCAVTPNRKLATIRVRPNADANPIATPSNATLMP